MPIVVCGLLIAGVGSIVVQPGVAGAATDTVTNCSGSASKSGSLPYEVAKGSSGDTIKFSVTCPSSSPITLASTIDINTGLTIHGPGASSLVVSGNNAVQGFDVASGVRATISGLTIEGGNTDASGGGIENDGTLSITDSTVSGNDVSFGIGGGGIYNDGTLTVTDSSVSGNSVDYGTKAVVCDCGGSGIYNDGTLTVTDSSVSDNSASTISSYAGGGYGGGIENDGTLSIADSTVSHNSATISGGGIGGSGSLTITDSTASGNSATIGGGIDNSGTSSITDSTVSDNSATGVSFVGGGGIDNGGSITINSSTVSGNTTDSLGGGIDNNDISNTDSTLTINSSTVSGNTATGGEGGGIDNGSIDYSGGTVTINSSTVSGNTAPGGEGGGIENDGMLTVTATIVAKGGSGLDCVGTSDPPVTDAGYNLDDDGSCGFGGTSLSDTPAGLDSNGLENSGGPTQTIALEPDSPAIGAVNSASLCSTPDQRGVARPTPCDVGASQAVDQAPTFTSASHATFIQGVPGTFTPKATGIPIPSITESGVLPSGMTFTGSKLHGTPSVHGTFHISFTASNGVLPKGVQNFTLTVLGLHVVTTMLPTATIWKPYSATLSAIGGTPPYSWMLVKSGGGLPLGLHLTAGGVLHGTASLRGTFKFEVRVPDEKRYGAQSATAILSLVIT